MLSASGPPAQIGALVHLAARAEVADPRILRRAERAGVEAVAAADAEVLGVQHHGVGRGVEAVHRADRRAGRVGAVHAGHRDRALARLAVVDGDDAPAVDAPRHLVLVLAGGDAGVALDATVGVAEEFHSSHGRCSLRRSDLTERGFGFLHAGDRIVAVGRDRVDALAEHDRIGALRILAALVVALEPAGEVERASRRRPCRRARSPAPSSAPCALFSAPVTQTQPPSLMPRSAASAGLISMNMSCCSSASHLLERVSSPPPSYSTRRPEVRMIGNCLAMPLSTAAFCTVEAEVGHAELRAHPAASDTCATRSGRGV